MPLRHAFVAVPLTCFLGCSLWNINANCHIIRHLWISCLQSDALVFPSDLCYWLRSYLALCWLVLLMTYFSDFYGAMENNGFAFWCAELLYEPGQIAWCWCSRAWPWGITSNISECRGILWVRQCNHSHTPAAKYSFCHASGCWTTLLLL